MRKVFILLVSALLILPFSAFAEKEGEGSSLFSIGLGFGTQGLYNMDYIPGAAEDRSFFYQFIGLYPQITTEKFDMSLDLVLRFRFDGGANKDKFQARQEDWRTWGAWEVFNLYLPKIRSLRYGTKEDPTSLRMGDIDGMTLGNGFIVSSYTNGLFQPENRVLGAAVDIAGSIVDIPYFGIEAFTANAARFDLAAGRLFVHPLAAFEASILKRVEIGGTFAVDRDPYYFAKRYAMYTSVFDSLWNDEKPVQIYGLDFKAPLLTDPAFSLSLFGDRAGYKSMAGWMGGASGKLANAITWEGQFRKLDENFIPEYFDASYDLYRPEKYAFFNRDSSGTYLAEECNAYLASLGLSLMQDKFVLKLVSQGPIGNYDNRLYSWQGIMELKEGLIPHFYFDILYDKKNMADIGDFTAWKQGSLLRARLHYHTGPVVLSLVYILRYIPTDSGIDRQVLAGLEGRIRL